MNINTILTFSETDPGYLRRFSDSFPDIPAQAQLVIKNSADKIEALTAQVVELKRRQAARQGSALTCSQDPDEPCELCGA